MNHQSGWLILLMIINEQVAMMMQLIFIGLFTFSRGSNWNQQSGLSLWWGVQPWNGLVALSCGRTSKKNPQKFVASGHLLPSQSTWACTMTWVALICSASCLYRMAGGKSVDDHSWGRKAIDPGNHVLQVALDTACKTHGNIATV